MNTSKYVPFLVAFAFASARAAIISADVNSVAGKEFVSVGEHGAIQVFTPARVVSPQFRERVYQGDLGLAAGELVVGLPAVWQDEDANAFDVAAVVRKGAVDVVRRWSVALLRKGVANSLKGTELDLGGTVAASLPRQGSTKPLDMLVRVGADWKMVTFASDAKPAMASVSGLPSGGVQYLVAEQTNDGVVHVANDNGTISTCTRSGSSYSCVVPVTVLGTVDATRRKFAVRPWLEGNDWYSIDLAGAVWKRAGGGSPSQIGTSLFSDARSVSVAFGRIQILSRGGTLTEIDASTGATLQRGAWHMIGGEPVMDATGVPVATGGLQFGASPSAFGAKTANGHILWGYYHHLGGFAISEFSVTPKAVPGDADVPGSPKPTTAILRWAVAGNANAWYRIVASMVKTDLATTSNEIVVAISNNAISATPRTMSWTIPKADALWDIHLQVCPDEAGFKQGVEIDDKVCADSTIAFKVDLTLPTLAAGWPTLAAGSGSWPLPTPSTGCAVLGNPVSFDVGTLYDAVPFGDEKVDVALELSGKNGGGNWTVKPVNGIVQLDGYANGVQIPSGSYDLRWVLGDAVGNIARVPLQTSCIDIRQFDPEISIWASPLLVRSYGTGEVVFHVTGNYDFPDAADLDVQIDGKSIGWTEALTASYGSFSFEKSFRLPDLNVPGITPAAKGEHKIRAVLTSRIDKKTREALGVYAVDQFKTTIVEPKSASARTGNVAIRGMAIPPELVGEEGQAAYFAYWIKTPAVGFAASLKSANYAKKDLLFTGREWKPLLVPRANQRKSLDRLARNGRDALFPSSNIGLAMSSAEGLLATFVPDAEMKSSDVTVLVVSQESSVGPISYDAVDFKWEPGSGEKGQALVLARTDKGASGPLDIETSEEPATFTASWPEHAGRTVHFMVYNADGSRELREGEATLVLGTATGAKPEAIWNWDGRDFTGRQVPSGKYIVVVAGVDPSAGEQTASVELDVKSSPLGDAAQVFKVSPTLVPSLVSIGIPQVVTSEVELIEQLDWSIVAMATGSSTAPDAEDLSCIDEKGATATCPDKTIRYSVVASRNDLRADRIDWGFTSGTTSFLADLVSEDGKIPVHMVLVVKDKQGTNHHLVRSIKVETAQNLLVDEDLGLTKGIFDQGTVAEGEIWSPASSAGYRFKALASGELSYFPKREIDDRQIAEGKQVLRYFKDVPLKLGFAKYYNSAEIATAMAITGVGVQKPVFRDRRYKRPTWETMGDFNSFFARKGGTYDRGLSIEPANDLFDDLDETELRSRLGTNWYGDPAWYFGREAVVTPPSDGEGSTTEDPAPVDLLSSTKWAIRDPLSYTEWNSANGFGAGGDIEVAAGMEQGYQHACVQTGDKLSTWTKQAKGSKCKLTVSYGGGRSSYFKEINVVGPDCPDKRWENKGEVYVKVAKVPGAQCSGVQGLTKTLQWSHRWDAFEWWQDVEQGSFAMYFKKPAEKTEDALGALLWHALLHGDGSNVANTWENVDKSPNTLLYPVGGFTQPRCSDNTSAEVICNNPAARIYWEKRYDWGRDGDNQYNDLSTDFDSWHEDATPQYFFTDLPALNWKSGYLFQKKDAKDFILNAHEMMLAGAHDDGEKVEDKFKIGNRTRAITESDFLGWEESHYEDCVEELTKGDNGVQIEHTVDLKKACLSARGGRKVGQRGFAYRLDYDGTLPTGLVAADIVENFFRRNTADGFVSWMYPQSDEKNLDDVVFHPRLDISNRMRTVTWDTTWASYPFGAYESEFKNNLKVERADYTLTDGTLRTVDQLLGNSWDPQFKGEYKRLRKDSWIEFSSSDCQGDACYSSMDDAAKTAALALFKKESKLEAADIVGVLKFDVTSRFSELFDYIQDLDNYENSDRKYLFIVRKTFMPQIQLSTRVEGQTLPEVGDDLPVVAIVAQDWTGTAPKLTAYVAYLNEATVVGDWDSRKSDEMAPTEGYFYGGGDFNEDKFRTRDAAPRPGTDNADFFAAVNSSLYTFPACAVADQSLTPFCLDTKNTLAFAPTLKGAFAWDVALFEKDGRTPHSALVMVDGTGARATGNTTAELPKSFDLDLKTDATLRSWVTLSERKEERIPVTYTDEDDVEYAFQGYRIGYVDASKKYHPIPVNPLLQVDTKDNYLGDDSKHERDFWNHRKADDAVVLGEWDVTGLNGDIKVVFQGIYKSAEGVQKVYAQVVPVRVGAIKMPEATSPVEIKSSYQRASVTMPVGTVDENTAISIHPMALKDIPLPANFPQVVPVGPVLQVLTTGQKVFDPAQRPRLNVKFSARELWAIHGKKGTDGTLEKEFDEATLTEAVALIREVMPSYKIHLLSETGRLDAQPTIATLVDCDLSSGKNVCRLELTAEVSHFSYAMVLFDVSNDGLPTIVKTVRSLSGGFEVQGLRDIDREPVPDVEWVLSPLPKLDKFPESELWTAVTVEKDGSFKIVVPPSQALDGPNYVYVRYKDASIASKAFIDLPPSTLDVTDWGIEGNGFAPTCGEDRVFAKFTPNRDGVAGWTIRNSQGLPVASGEALFKASSTARVGWDGCTRGMSQPDGNYTWEFRFFDASTENTTLPVVVGTLTSAVVSSIYADKKWLIPSLTDPEHGILFSVTFEGPAPTDPVLVLAGPNNLKVQLALTKQSDGTWAALWTGTTSGASVETGKWSAALSTTVAGAGPRKDVEIRSATPPVITLTLSPAAINPPGTMTVLVETKRSISAALWVEASPATAVSKSALLGRPASLLDAEIREDLSEGARKWSLEVRSMLTGTGKVKLHWTTADGQAGITTADFTTSEGDWLAASDLAFGEGPLYPQLFGRKGFASRKRSIDLVVKAKAEGKANLSISCGTDFTQSYDVDLKPGDNTYAWPDATTDMSKVVPPSNCTWTVKAYRKLVATELYLVGSKSFQTLPMPRALIVRPYDNAMVSAAKAAEDRLKELGIADVEQATVALDVLDYMEAVPKGVLVLLEEAPDRLIYDGGSRNSLIRFIQAGGKVAFGGGLPLLHNRSTTGTVENSPDDRILELHGFSAFDIPSLRRTSTACATDPFVRQACVSSLQWSAQNGQGDLFAALCGQPQCEIWNGSTTDLSVDLTRLPSDVYSLLIASQNIKNKKDELETVARAGGYYLRPVYTGYDPSKTGEFLVVPAAKGADKTNQDNHAKDVATSTYRFFFSVDLGLSKKFSSLEAVPVSAGTKGPKDWIDPAKPGEIRPLRLVRGQSAKLKATGLLIGDIPRGQKATSTIEVDVPLLGEDDGKSTFSITFPGLGLQPINAPASDATRSWTIPDDAPYGDQTVSLKASAATWKITRPVNGEPTLVDEIERITVNNETKADYVVVSVQDPVVTIDPTLATTTTGSTGRQNAEFLRGIPEEFSARPWIVKGTISTDHTYKTMKVSLVMEYKPNIEPDAEGNIPKHTLVASTEVAAGKDIPFQFDVRMAAKLVFPGINSLTGVLKVRDAFDNVKEVDVKITLDRVAPTLQDVYPMVDNEMAPIEDPIDKARLLNTSNLTQPSGCESTTPKTPISNISNVDDTEVPELTYHIDTPDPKTVSVKAEAKDETKLWKVTLTPTTEDGPSLNGSGSETPFEFVIANGSKDGFNSADLKSWSLPTGKPGALYTGRYVLTVEDFAGNISTIGFLTVVDQSAPEVNVYHARKTIVDRINDFTENVCQKYALESSYQTWAPLYDHPLPDQNYVDNDKKNPKPGYKEFWDKPDAETSPSVAKIMKRLPEGTLDWEGEIESDEGEEYVPIVVYATDLSKVTFKAWIDGSQIPLDHGTCANMANFSKYCRSGDAHDRSTLASHPNSIYFEVKMGSGVVRHRVKIEAEDAGGRTTSVELIVGEPLQELVMTDPQGDRTGEGADWGDVYLSRKAASQGSWLHGMVHTWTADHAGKDRTDALYVDLDQNVLTGSGVVATANGVEQKGFDVRVRFHKISDRDDETGTKIGYSQWQSGAWSEERQWTRLSVDGNIKGGANQLNEPWTRTTGEGDQLLPTGNIGRAPGGVVEFSVLLDKSTSIGQLVRVFLDGSVDDAGDDKTGGAINFEMPPARDITPDGVAKDWYHKWLPQNGIASYYGRSTIHNLSSSPVGVRQQRVELKLKNTGWRRPSEIVVRQFLIVDKCSDLRADEDLSHNGWRLVSEVPRRANELQGHEDASDVVKYIEWRIDGSLLTPGSSLQGAPWAVLTATSNAACTQEMVTNSVTPLASDLEIRDNAGHLLLGGETPVPGTRRQASEGFVCGVECAAGTAATTSLTASPLGPKWFTVTRSAANTSVTTTGTPGQLRIEGVGVFNDQILWPVPAGTANIYHAEVEPVKGSATWSIKP